MLRPRRTVWPASTPGAGVLTRMTAIAGVAATILVLGGDASGRRSYTHPTGLTVLTGEESLPDQVPVHMNEPLGVADRLLSWFPDDLAGPWVSWSPGTIIIGAATPEGAAIMAEVAAGDAAAVVAHGYQGGAIEKSLPDLSTLAAALASGLAEARSVAHSDAELGAVKDEITSIQLDTNNVWMLRIDDARNRVIATAPSLADDLAAELVRRYGTRMVAVEIAPWVPIPLAGSSSWTPPSRRT